MSLQGFRMHQLTGFAFALLQKGEGRRKDIMQHVKGLL